ncbi:PEP-CTERM sorting domain-containing protein [Verrucomicrobiaceae bacterium N1E253]|uniref:PEP-CTERM sorting domain-containing protein n=2 Tax=Oceaniferula marina TaxID=2748318 RepID=A0A851GJJ1_9BACT|nr:PEP-CTERM sorting domain-containing protein [Oceaniferula marina]
MPVLTSPLASAALLSLDDLSNASFESNTGVPNDWDNSFSDGRGALVETPGVNSVLTTASDGSNYLRFWNANEYVAQRLRGVTDTSGGAVVDLTAADISGQTFRVSFDIGRVEPNLTDGSLTVGLQYNDGAWRNFTVVQGSASQTRDSWVRYSYDITVDRLTTSSGVANFFVQKDGANSRHVAIDNISIVAIPEPTSAALLGLGGLSLILRRRM